MRTISAKWPRTAGSGARLLGVLLLSALLSACPNNNGNRSTALGSGGGGSGGGGPVSGPRACALSLPPPGTSLSPVEPACTARGDARLNGMSDAGIESTSALGLPPGRYALPATATPSYLVVMFHGHQQDSCAWRDHLRLAAANGAVAVAMDYSAQADRDIPGFGFIYNWGWAVRSGASDSLHAMQYFLDRFPSITTVINFGVSMGGNVSGYAAYSDLSARADCSPAWDYWITAEGVHNLTEEYIGARLLAPINTTAAQAVLEIEEENVGTLEMRPEAYAEITNFQQVGDLGYLKGAFLSHGLIDQTVPADQSVQMATALRGQGVPTFLHIVNDSDHVWEGDGTRRVMQVALDALVQLLQGGAISDGADSSSENP